MQVSLQVPGSSVTITFTVISCSEGEVPEVSLFQEVKFQTSLSSPPAPPFSAGEHRRRGLYVRVLPSQVSVAKLRAPADEVFDVIEPVTEVLKDATL